MTEPTTVTGGAGGVIADYDDLRTLAELGHAAAVTVADVVDDLRSPLLRSCLLEGAEHDRCGYESIERGFDDLVGNAGRLPLLETHLQSISALVLNALQTYQAADSGILDAITQAFGHPFEAMYDLLQFRYLAAVGELAASFPAYSELALLALDPLERAYALAVPDGHAVLHDLGADSRPASTAAPRCLADLIAGLALRNEGRHGEISVSWVRGGDGRRRVIVDVPGTKSWNPLPNHDVTSVGTDITAMAGRDTAYEEGIFQALGAAGVGPDDDVLLVGHSEGGIVAVDAARDAARSGRFRITHVVTAGSPVGKIVSGVPERVQVLALENSADLVPRLDDAANPDRPNVITVTVKDERGSVSADHDVGTVYRRAAAAADATCSSSIDEFMQSAHGFLSGSSLDTHSYQITRGF